MDALAALRELEANVQRRNRAVGELASSSVRLADSLAHALAAGAASETVADALSKLMPSAELPSAVPAPRAVTTSENEPPPRPGTPQQAAARRLVRHVREAFAQAGDPETMTLVKLLDYLRQQEPVIWTQWDGRPDCLIMVGRTMANVFRAARLDLPTFRDNRLPGRPTAYRLDHVLRALQ